MQLRVQPIKVSDIHQQTVMQLRVQPIRVSDIH